MNRSIRCEPLPFPLASDQAAAKGATLFSRRSNPPGNSSTPEFGDVLKSELEEKRIAEKERKEAEASNLFGVAPSAIHVLQQEISVPFPESSSETEPGLNLPRDIDAANLLDPPHAGRAGEAEKPSATPLQLALEGLKLAEQKLPSALERVSLPPEQFAGIAPDPAKKASGMLAAQGHSMLSTSPKPEETAPEQNLILSSDSFEALSALSIERPILVRAAAPLREATLHPDLELADFTALDPMTPEWSSFEGISETTETHSANPSESIEIAQAIRGHVQLLKSSGHEKLDVVLRPDANTELRLHVEKVNGQILVQARCDRGDFARLDANWSAVQQTLANQGVRVDSLQHGSNLQNQQHWNQSAFQQQSSADQKRDHNFIERKIATSIPTQPAQPARQPVGHRTSGRGWQSWA